LIAAVVAIDVFLKSFIIVSTHRQRHVASETGFKHNSPNPNPDSFNRISRKFTASYRQVYMYNAAQKDTGY